MLTIVVDCTTGHASSPSSNRGLPPSMRRRSKHSKSLLNSPANTPPGRSESPLYLPLFAGFISHYDIHSTKYSNPTVICDPREKEELLNGRKRLEQENVRMQHELHKLQEQSQEVTIAGAITKHAQADTSATGGARYHSPYIT